MNAITREDVGLNLLLAGLGLGLSLGLFAVLFDGMAFYQAWFAPAATGALPLGGFALDAGVLLSLAMTVGGIACFPSTPPAPATRPVPAAPVRERRAARVHRRRDRRVVRVPAP